MRARLWRSGTGLARGNSVLFVPFGACQLVRVGWRPGDGIAIAEPLCEIAIPASLRAKRRELRDPGPVADRTRAGWLCHAVMIWAWGASSARAGSVSSCTCLPVRRASSAIQSDLSRALRAG